MNMNTSTKIVNVWDPLVRIGHWTLVIAFFTAYFTEDDFMTQHVWAGYIVGAVVLFRIVWGFVGSKHARFSDFVYSPSSIFAYLKGLINRKPQHYVGHNPAGGAMVIALLLSLTVTVYTGLALYAVEENSGPLAGIIANSDKSTPAISIVSTAYADEDANENENKNEQDSSTANKKGEDFWEELHEFFANFTLLLVALHIGGVILSSYIDKEKLIKAMVTGKKEIPKDSF